MKKDLKTCLSILLSLFILIMTTGVIQAQFVSRYPLLEGYRNHNYFEGYEMPVLGTGPIDPVATPDGRSLIFSAKGWLWRYDLETGEAFRITMGGESDFRPSLSRDGKKMVFVRDNTLRTKIMLMDLDSGKETTLIESGKIDLDPAFSPDGREVYYSSSEAGDLDIWKINISTGEKTRVTSDRGLERHPIPLPDGKSLIMIVKSGGDKICLFNMESGERKILKMGAIISQMRPSLSPDGKTLVVNWPAEGHFQFYQLWILNLDNPDYFVNLTYDLVLPLTPTWSSDQKTIFFVESDENQDFILKKMPVVGGSSTDVPVKSWNWGGPMGRITIQTRMEGEAGLLPTRLSVSDGQGHPVFPDICNARFDSQNGLNYFHSQGIVELTVPAGKVNITAAHGFSAPAVSIAKDVPENGIAVAELSLKRIWNPQQNGWYSGDNHFHLNYGGPYYLTPDHLVPMMRAEDLDAAAPMTANLHTRNMDLEWANWVRNKPPLIYFSQEVRDHFLGHIGLMGIKEWYWPWFYGPYYPVYSKEDRPNSEVLLHAREQGGLNIYVHPIYRGNPFDEDNLGATPTNLIPDAMLGHMDALEIACIWINELGTCELWYRLLNLGLPIVPTGGSDTFPNYYRHMIFGCARSYAHLDGQFTWENYVRAIREGRSFTTTGPLIDFRVGDLRPGDVFKEKGKATEWTLDVYSPVAVEKIEILINGKVASQFEGLPEAGKKTYSGKINLPQSGWIAARAYGGPNQWPMMYTGPFAHSAPVWIGEIGSRDPSSSRSAAADLLRVLKVAEERMEKAYEGASIPNLRSQFKAAKEKLEKYVK